MNKLLVKLFGFVLLSFLASAVLADEMHYQTKKLPDGSTETDYSGSDGSQVKQITHPDGTVETTATDGQGNQSITTQHPDGSMDIKTKKAGSTS